MHLDNHLHPISPRNLKAANSLKSEPSSPPNPQGGVGGGVGGKLSAPLPSLTG